MADEEIHKYSTVKSENSETEIDLLTKGDTLFWQHDYKQAKKCFQNLISRPSLNPIIFARCLNSLGAANVKLENYEDALDNYYEQLDALLKLDISKHQENVVKCYMSIGMVYWLTKNWEQAVETYKKALTVLYDGQPDPNLTSEIYKNIANVYTNKHEFNLALEYFEKALEIDRYRLKTDHPDFGQTFANIGAMYNTMEDYQTALHYFQKAYEVWLKSLQPTHIHVQSIETIIRDVQEKLECSLANINQDNEMKSFLRKQEELKEYYYNFPDIEEIMDRNTENVRQTEKFTQSILSQTPLDDVREKTTACHVIYNLFKTKNSQCLFFDCKQGMKLHDASGNLSDLCFNGRPFVLKLKNSDGLGKQKYKIGGNETFELVKILNRMITQNESDSVLDNIQDRLSNAHQTKKENICLQCVFVGSFNIVYEVLDDNRNDIELLVELPKRLKANFEQYEAVKMHPLLVYPAFDISMFDEKGNKTYSNTRETYKIGPLGRTVTFMKPAGWTRYGLKVLNKYSDGNKWLQPFGDNRNWYRAFHGTSRAAADDFKKSGQSSSQQFALADSMANIHKTSFRQIRMGLSRDSIYCSPDPMFSERNFASQLEINTKQGKKRYKTMLQVAVNPDGVIFTTDNNIWYVPNPKDIRPYGILIKEV